MSTRPVSSDTNVLRGASMMVEAIEDDSANKTMLDLVDWMMERVLEKLMTSSLARRVILDQVEIALLKVEEWTEQPTEFFLREGGNPPTSRAVKEVISLN